MKYHHLIYLFLIIAFACSSPTGTEVKEEVSNNQVSVSANGAVATAHPLATLAAVEILENGGNAADAAVAAAFTLAVVEPSMSGLGGRLQAIVRSAEGTVTGIDATTQAGIDYDPETAPRASYGYPVIGIPGVVKGLDKLLSDHGTKTLKEVTAFAINIAENGFEILPGEARRHSMMIEQIREFSGTSQYFLNGDTTYVEGVKLVQKDLANTLRLIASEGESVFYEGEIAERIVADVKENGGTLSMEALKAYEAKSSTILNGNYRGYDLHGLYMPSYGAITIEMLHILENLEMNTDDAEWAKNVFEANRLAYMDRRNQDTPEDALRLTSKDYAKELVAKELMENAEVEGEPLSYFVDGHTTHLSVADKDGNMVALTQSLGPNMGSRVVTPGLGFLYATTLGGYLGDFQPGQRASSHISPFIVTKDGEPFMVLGAAGGSRIITAIVQVISRVVDQNLPIYEAMAAGRVHTGDTTILVETHPGTFGPELLVELESIGYSVTEVDQPGRFGRVHAIIFDSESGQWTGAADPDWEGTAASPLEEK